MMGKTWHKLMYNVTLDYFPQFEKCDFKEQNCITVNVDDIV